jgi:hypothetical protein
MSIYIQVADLKRKMRGIRHQIRGRGEQKSHKNCRTYLRKCQTRHATEHEMTRMLGKIRSLGGSRRDLQDAHTLSRFWYTDVQHTFTYPGSSPSCCSRQGMSSVIVFIAVLPDRSLLASLSYRKDEIAALIVVKNRCGKTDHSRLRHWPNRGGWRSPTRLMTLGSAARLLRGNTFSEPAPSR